MKAMKPGYYWAQVKMTCYEVALLGEPMIFYWDGAHFYYGKELVQESTLHVTLRAPIAQPVNYPDRLPG